jgi:hypothetical protein
MKPNLDMSNQDEMIRTLKTPLAIIRLYSEYLLEACDRLSTPQRNNLLKAVQSQTILLEHLLDEMAGHLARLDEKTITDERNE